MRSGRKYAGLIYLASCVLLLLPGRTAADNHPFDSDSQRRDYESRRDDRGDRYDRDRRRRESNARRDSRERYSYCRDLAQDESGYRGVIPAEYKRGSRALESALKGAASGAAASWITGGNKKERKKAAKRAAGLGLLIGALKDAGDNKKRKKNEKKRRRFQEELDRCMRRR